jgi:hypothetical protein
MGCERSSKSPRVLQQFGFLPVSLISRMILLMLLQNSMLLTDVAEEAAAKH